MRASSFHMNFFEQQDHARRQSRTLVILFALAVLAIVLAVNLALALLFIWAQGQPLSGPHSYPKGFFATNTLVTLGLIAGGTLIEMFNLRDGGDAVARMAGGTVVAPNTEDARERRLLNVVEEMALASGIACPRVYVLARETSINAFAAGYNANEAVIAVTHGALTRLTRDELQGVIGHEFSHILNGDMRLNVRLIGVLFGIQMIAGFGRHLMSFGWQTVDAGERNGKGTPLHIAVWVVGGILFMIGYIGIFCGRIIKSALSRQREFLADASAIQFTRNPDGLGNALRKIGGLTRRGGADAQIRHPNAEQLSHLFLNAVRPGLLAGWLATHPPLRERLRRIYGRDVALLDVPEATDASTAFSVAPERLPDLPYVAAGLAAGELDMQAASAAIAQTAAHAYGHGAPKGARLAPEIDQAVRDPHAATALVYALLLLRSTAANDRSAVLSAHLQAQLPAQAEQVTALLLVLAQLPGHARLPLLDLVMPALRQLTLSERASLLANVTRLIAADQRISLDEFVLQTVLTRRLDRHAGRVVPVRFQSLPELQLECAVLFSLTAHVMAPLLHQPAVALFMQAAIACPQLSLSERDLLAAHGLDFGIVKTALDRSNQLTPLAKPALIKALLAMVGEHAAIPLLAADLLRAMCAALDAPMPPRVAEVYAASGWPDA
ncbi:M48 family metalloprotease [Herminiimonas sp. NPDC097707]|uniref:M48 family metalloprotease n=1 Tax=Herminiimonas sp. NPDC097707 TaxID=3364007 RepID=UPI00383A928A